MPADPGAANVADPPASLAAGPSRLVKAGHQAAAAARGTTMAASARGLTPWLRPATLPEVAYPKIFVVGCARSGTTWVAEILGHHPRVVGGAESHLYPILHRSIEASGRRSARAWAHLFYAMDLGRVVGRPTGLRHYVDRATLARLGRSVLARATSDAEATALLARAVLDHHFTARGGTPERVLVEKTPQHVLYARRILADFPEAHLVEVIRDGRDVCVSMQMRSTRVSAIPGDRAVQVRTWAESIRAGRDLQTDPALRPRVSVVHYEALESDPHGEVERLFTETGLGATPELVADTVAATAIDRYPTGAGEFRFRGRSGSWSEMFSDDDLRVFRELAGDAFEAAGYSY